MGGISCVGSRHNKHCGERHCLSRLLEKKTQFQLSLLKNRNEVFYLDLLSNILDVSYALFHLIKKKRSSPILYMSKQRQRGIKEVTNKWTRCFMVIVFMQTKFAEMALSIDCWWKKLNVNSIYQKKKKLGMILRSTKQRLSSFTCLPAFNSKEKLHRRCNQRSHFIDDETEAQRY